MICYFPFTYISDELIGTLTRYLGPLAVYQGLARLVPDHMNDWAARSQLEVRLPCDVDQGRLQQVLKQYRDWAELHQGGLADLSAFLQNASMGAPLMDETNPTQISTQIRRHGQETLTVDPLFQACLFLALSQEYDIHQEALVRDLGAIERMEQQMLSHLEGGARNPDPLSVSAQDPGLYMTEARLQAWSMLAGCDVRPSWAFITTSRTVLETMLEKLPQARPLLQWELGAEAPSASDDAAVAARRDFLQTSAFSADPWAVPVPSGLPTAGSTDIHRVTFYCLPGSPPRKSLAALLRPTGLDRFTFSQTPQPQNTLIGVIERP